jgi:hypothetical protein
MKSLLTSLLIFAGTLSFSNSSIAKIVSEKIVKLPVNIGKAKLKFTNLGYGQTYFVKIIIPELAAETILNHRNVGEDGPCLFTEDTDKIEDVLQGRPEIIQTEFKITLIKRAFKHGDKCTLTLIENIKAKVRGFHFEHNRNIDLPERVTDDCQ